MRGLDLREKFEIGAIIGQGGMGEVYEAIGPNNEFVAIKRMNSVLASRPKMRARFENEVDALEQCRGLFVLDLLEVGTVDDCPAYVSEACRCSLMDLCKNARPAIERSVQILSEVLVALDRVHLAGFVHRDVKPSNILIAYGDETVRLADFGIARHPQRRVTDPGVLVGTPPYAAPDMRLNPSSATPSHDMFSVGLMAYSMLTGHSTSTFVHGDEGAFSGLDPGLYRAVSRATHPVPRSRYASAGQMIVDLQQALKSMTEQGDPDPYDCGIRISADAR